MSTRTDPPRPVFGRSESSFPGETVPRPLAVAEPPETAGALPQSYGEAALELFVVDPGNVFICWEITSDQLAAAQSSLGPAFDSRKLRVDIVLESDREQVLCSMELFGDVGRWFLAVPPLGAEIVAQLYFEAAGSRHAILSAGAVALPRITPIEPDSLEELHVSYGFGPGGCLSLAGTSRAAPRATDSLGIALPALRPPAASWIDSAAGRPEHWSGSWPSGSISTPGAQDD